MNPSDRQKPNEDQKSEELSLAARAAARRALGIVASGERSGAPEMYLRAVQRASELLDDAAESVLRSDFQIRGLSSSKGDPRSNAPAMSSPNEPHATAVAVPTTLMTQQAGMCVLSGSTRAVPLPDVLAFLCSLKKSGILWIRAAAETFTLQLEEGLVVHASSSECPRGFRLGDILVKMGCLSQDRLDQFLATYTRQSGKLGVALERAGLLTSTQLAEALEQHVRSVFQRLLAVESSTYSFTARSSNSNENRIRLDIEHVLRPNAAACAEETDGLPAS